MSKLYVAREGVQYGPFGQDRVYELIAQGKLIGTDLVWCPGMSSWELAGKVLAELMPKSAPTPPTILAVPHSAAPSSPRTMQREQHAEQVVPFANRSATQAPAYLQPRPENVIPESAVRDNTASAQQEAASTLTLPNGKPLRDVWRRRFEKIERIVGPRGSKAASLGFREKAALYTGVYGETKNSSGFNINILAAIFGPIYYLIKGMWRQAIYLTLLWCFVWIFIYIQIIGVIGLAEFFEIVFDFSENTWNILDRSLTITTNLLVFGGPANYYYYRKITKT